MLHRIPLDNLGWLTWYRFDRLSFTSYPIRKYDEDPEEMMTTHQDALMQRDEDINVKD